MKAAYSHRAFPPTIRWSVYLSVCPVHCGKTADQIWMLLGMVNQMVPGVRQVAVMGSVHEKKMMGPNVERPIITNGEFVAELCESV